MVMPGDNLTIEVDLIQPIALSKGFVLQFVRVDVQSVQVR